MACLTLFSYAFSVFATLASPLPAKDSLPACTNVITRQEAQKHIPSGLLKAIAMVESGMSPWAVNARGHAHNFTSKEKAATYIRQLIDEGVGNIGIGCMQLHYASHHRSFRSVEEMLEPEKNIAFAAKLLKNLESRHGSLDTAVKRYHSALPSCNKPYKKRVYGMWAKIRRPERDAKAGKKDALKPVSFSPHAAAVKIDKKSLKKQLKSGRKIKFGVGASVREDRS